MMRGAGVATGFLIVSTVAAGLLVTARASALWNPSAGCATCPTMSTVAFTWRSSRDHQLHVNDTNTVYTNWTDQAAKVLASSAVRTFEFRVNSFDLETNYDYLKYGESVFNLTGSLTGTITSGTWYSYTPPTGESLQSKPMILYFDTDYSVVRPGFDLNQARVCCSGTNITKPTLLVGVRNLGILKAAEDVVFAKFPADSNVHHTVALWADQTAVDFDLYVRCNGEPTDSTYTYRSIAGSSSIGEFIEIPSGASCVGDWYVAAVSYSGSGTFSLVRSQHYAAQHKSVIKVGMDFAASSAEKDQMRTTITRSARMFHAMTEGGALVEQIDFYQNATSCSTGCNGGQCDVCMQNAGSTGNCGASCGGGVVTFNRGCWQMTAEGGPLVMAHEWGHCLLGLHPSPTPDEYIVSGGTQYDTCGHSNMAFGRLGKNRFNLCYSADHGQDMSTGIPSGSTATANSSWDYLYNNSKTPFGFGETPDNASYLDFPFAHTDSLTTTVKVGKLVDK